MQTNKNALTLGAWINRQTEPKAFGCLVPLLPSPLPRLWLMERKSSSVPTAGMAPPSPHRTPHPRPPAPRKLFFYRAGWHVLACPLLCVGTRAEIKAGGLALLPVLMKLDSVQPPEQRGHLSSCPRPPPENMAAGVIVSFFLRDFLIGQILTVCLPCATGCAGQHRQTSGQQ
jgi:hypothetical protein